MPTYYFAKRRKLRASKRGFLVTNSRGLSIERIPILDSSWRKRILFPFRHLGVKSDKFWETCACEASESQHPVHQKKHEVALKFLQCEEKLAHVNRVCGANAVTLMMRSCATLYNANLFALLRSQKWDVLGGTCGSALSGLFNVAAPSGLTY